MPTQEQITEFLQKLLMIAGGFGAGYLASWLACVGFDKTIVKGKSPDGLHKWARRIGGALVALVVAFFVFRGGTGTGAGGPDTGPGTGQPTSPNAASTDPTPATEKRPQVTEVGVVFVTVYAGTAVERGTEKFFAIGDPTGSKVDREAVGEAIKATRREVGRVELVYQFDATASENTNAFIVLKEEAKEHELTPITKKEFDNRRK